MVCLGQDFSREEEQKKTSEVGKFLSCTRRSFSPSVFYMR